jgi:hypothetical protein
MGVSGRDRPDLAWRGQDGLVLKSKPGSRLRSLADALI